ncbi:hypothetical protein [Spongiimicrobium salis]|uniref:hypothetical protein n=1 Tax=Spongiimicrobium salis TaxID=1667022 RepID=UPI00374D68B1
MRRICMVLIGLFLCQVSISCAPNNYQTIPLDQLDPKFKNRGELIVGDILTSLNHPDGARYLLDKEYITPKIHGRIMSNLDMYNEAYVMGTAIIGSITDYELFEVVDKKILKTMRYRLITANEDIKAVELKIDVSNTYRLADFYLYATSTDGTLEYVNILPESFR